MASVHRRVTRTGGVIYRAIWTEPGPNGTRRKRSKNFDRASDAKAFAARMEQEVERRGVGDPEKHTLEGYLKRWIATLADRGEHSPTTLAALSKRRVDIACRYIGHIPLEKLSPADLDQLYATLLRRGGIARKANADGSKDARPLTRAHRAARPSRPARALERARKWKLIGENPAKDAQRADADQEPRQGVHRRPGHTIARGRRARCRRPMPHRVVSGRGLRRSEVLGLAWDSVDLDRRHAGNPAHGSPVEAQAGDARAAPRRKARAHRRDPGGLVDLLREQKARVQRRPR